jgi:hypothetical protein
LVDLDRTPLVSARAPTGPGEIAGAGGMKQATKLGRRAQACGWALEAVYWRAADETEGCALRLVKLPMRAVATWKRVAGRAGEKTGWAADLAYAWREDVARTPTKLTHTQLEGLIK